MPTAISPNPRAGSAAPDDLDKLFNYDDAVDDFLKDLPLNNDNQNSNTAPQGTAKNIDEEVIVRKKRRPNPKLDDNRLLSKEGIQRLRKITKTRLRFRGKGHEFDDIARLLNTYQLWLDDLYPRAKFKDALGMVEKLGHSKRMQVTRKTWLDETKPHRRDEILERVGDVEMSGALSGKVAEGSEETLFRDIADAQTTTGAAVLDATVPDAPDAPDEDELDALLAQNETSASATTVQKPTVRRGPFEEDDDEDELDALLAEQPSVQLYQSALSLNKGANRPTRHGHFEDDTADEEEAMASTGGVW